MILRILESQWSPFVESLCGRQDVETAGVILAERLHGGTLLARHCLAIPEDGYQIRQVDRLRIDPVAFNRLVRLARDRGLSVITIHTHPGTDRPWFSSADDQGDSRLMPSLFAQMAGPHGSVVVAGETRIPTARVWSGSGAVDEVTVRVVGRVLRTHAPGASTDGNSSCFDRQLLALGAAGQATLRTLHVAIVGLGGTGSVALAQLAHLGIGKLTVIDGDRVDSSNVSRVFGSTRADAGKTWKVDVAQRYVRELGLATRVIALRGHLGPEIAPTHFEDADVVLSCVDKHTPRALLNRMAYEKGIPLIDVGSAFRLDDHGRIASGAGRVVVVGPGRPCLACWGHIDPDRLRIESLSPTDRATAVAEGYISGADVPQPSVVAFNTAVAGAAVIELLRITTAFAGADDPPLRLAFDFASGTVRRNSLAAGRACSICTPMFGAGGTVDPAAGDAP